MTELGGPVKGGSMTLIGHIDIHAVLGQDGYHIGVRIVGLNGLVQSPEAEVVLLIRISPGVKDLRLGILRACFSCVFIHRESEMTGGMQLVSFSSP